ncbi:MAG: hypothetical protein JO317_06185 [Verrucomicrobiae bacterium]|nr:hypothetical protein [Verrucomicrobiae bacterium]
MNRALHPLAFAFAFAFLLSWTSAALAAEPAPLWKSDWSSPNDWRADWGLITRSWGEKNMAIVNDPAGVRGKVLRVFYPKGTWSPGVTEEAGLPPGGAGFCATLNLPPRDHARLRYDVYFPEDFDFVKAGKLPGLFGGAGNTGGHLPNGRDGFSARVVWREKGGGEIYAYLPESVKWGTDLGRGNWQFARGRWQTVEFEIQLNTPGRENGWVKAWHDGTLVLDQRNLRFRDIADLKIDGLMFSTFFGGADDSYATPKATYVYFDRFEFFDSPGPR